MSQDNFKNNLEEMTTAFQDLRHLNETNLSSFQEKLNLLDEQVAQTQNHLKNLDLALQRPSYSLYSSQEEKGSSKENPVYKEAFLDYVRKGIETNLQILQTKTLSTESDPEGGYLVPSTFSHQIIKTLEQWSTFRKLARVLTISTDALEILLDKEGAEAGWVSEKGSREETKTPELAKLRIPVHEMYAKPRATQKLLEDSQMNVQEWLIQKVAEKMAKIENHAFLWGNGRLNPRGILSYDLRPTDLWEWGTFEEFTTGTEGAFSPEETGADVLIAVAESLKPAYRSGACWLMSQSAITATRQLRLSKKYGSPYLWQPSFQTQMPETLLGYPVICLEELPSLKQGEPSSSILFGNFKEAYQIVDRPKTHILRDPYSAKPYVELYIRRRVGGDVVNFEAIKVLSFKKHF